MRSVLYWIEGPWAGRLAVMARPRGGDWLAEEARSWRDSGLDVVVSLLTREEVGELDLGEEERWCQENGLEFLHFPVQDRDVPASASASRRLAARLRAELTAGQNIGLHCRQGIGRSALLAACVLVLERVPPGLAFERIARARGCPVPDTTEQREWVESLARRVRPTAEPALL